MCELGVISRERLMVEVKLLLSANGKSYMPRRLAQPRMTFSDLECLKSTSSASRAISAVAELLVINGYWLTHCKLRRVPQHCRIVTLYWTESHTSLTGLTFLAVIVKSGMLSAGFAVTFF